VSGWEGVSVYDGTEWTNHLENSSVNNLAIDPDGYIWASTEEGFKIYDGENWAAPEGAANINFENGVIDFTFDQEGRLWAVVANDLYNLAVFDNGEWRFFTSDSFADCNTSLIFADSQGRIWFGKEDEKNTVYYVDGNDWFEVIGEQTTPLDVKECEDGSTCTTFESCTTYDGVKNIVEDSNGQIWVGNSNGLKVFDGESWTILDTETSDLPFDYIDQMTIDQFDRIWVLSESEAFHMLDETGNWQSFFPESGIHLSSTQKLTVDAQGNIWLTGMSIFEYEPPKP
jgi:ligand-binding sensor domain-containing protein